MKRLIALIIGSLTACTHAYHLSAPIQWMSRVVMPNMFAGPFRASIVPQELVIEDLPNTLTRESVPHFTLKSDGSINLEGTDTCIEAANTKSGSAVRLNRCTGESTQKWNWIPDSHGGSRIQLVDTDKCLDASIEGDYNAAPIVLWECESKGTEAWKFEELVPLPKQGRYMVMSLIALVGVAALSLGALLWQYTGPPKLIPTPGGGTSNVEEGGIFLNSPLATQMMVRPGSVSRRHGDAVMSGGKSVAGGGDTRGPKATEIDLSEPTCKQQAIRSADAFGECMANLETALGDSTQRIGDVVQISNAAVGQSDHLARRVVLRNGAAACCALLGFQQIAHSEEAPPLAAPSPIETETLSTQGQQSSVAPSDITPSGVEAQPVASKAPIETETLSTQAEQSSITPSDSTPIAVEPEPVPSRSALFDYDVPFRGEPESIEKFLGKATIMVNVKFDDPISLEQMPLLQDLVSKYSSEGLHVLAFPTNQGWFEADDDDTLRLKFKQSYGFGLFPKAVVLDKADLLGADQLPAYAWLTKNIPNPWGITRIVFNYEKILVNSNGVPLRRYPRKYPPSAMEADIQAALQGKELPPEPRNFKQEWDEAKREATKSEYAFKPGLNYYAFGSRPAPNTFAKR